jgi:sulfur-oxidizing protein SoxX
MKMKSLIVALLATSWLSASAADMTAVAEKYVAESFKPGENQDLSRLKQDQTQKECSRHRNKPPTKIAIALLEREQATLVYPADGKLLGDWKQGEKLVKAGFASRIGIIEPDKPNASRGGNCYACHAIDPKEVAAGNLGPSLTGYGRVRGQDVAMVKYTYDKIYNAQSLTPCSSMPRLGYHGILTPENIAHIAAYLLDPESSLNN